MSIKTKQFEIFVTPVFPWPSVKLCICCAYSYQIVSGRANGRLLMTSRRWQSLPSLTGPDAWTFFAQHQCLWWWTKTVKKTDSSGLARNRKKTKARIILIRTHRLSFLFSLYSPPPRIDKKPEDPHLPNRTFKYNMMLECMRLPLLGFLWFITSLFVTCGKKLAKTLFALKFEVETLLFV